MRFVRLLSEFRLFYVGLVKKNQTIFFSQIKKSCSLVYFSSAVDTVPKSVLASITPKGYQKVDILSFQHTFEFKFQTFFLSNDSHPWTYV